MIHAVFLEMSAINMLENLRNYLLILFNAGMIARGTYICFNGMTSEEPFQKKLLTHIKATIIINSIVILITTIQVYYE